MKRIPVREAIGLALCHDITEIIPGKYKGTAFRRGHVVRLEDIPHLLRLGKEYLYDWNPAADGLVHEDDAALRIAHAVAGAGVSFGAPREGRINFTAASRGLFFLDLDMLDRINSIPDVTLSVAHSLQEVAEGRLVAGTRVIPIAVPEDTVRAVEQCANDAEGRSAPLMSVLPFKGYRVGIVTTGNEVFHGRIQDGFGSVLHKKLVAWGCSVHSQEIVPDEPEETMRAMASAIAGGATLITVTGGMSVDPDDNTPAAIRSLGCDIVTYGAPVFPGAMFMLGYKGDIPVLGLPGCVMYHRASIFDLVMPRILAGLRITRRDIVCLAHGGLCEACPECRYPACAFGKG